MRLSLWCTNAARAHANWVLDVRSVRSALLCNHTTCSRIWPEHSIELHLGFELTQSGQKKRYEVVVMLDTKGSISIPFMLKGNSQTRLKDLRTARMETESSSFETVSYSEAQKPCTKAAIYF